MENTNEYLTLPKIAKLLNMCYMTLTTKVKNSNLQARKGSGKNQRYLYNVEEVTKLITDNPIQNKTRYPYKFIYLDKEKANAREICKELQCTNKLFMHLKRKCGLQYNVEYDSVTKEYTYKIFDVNKMVAAFLKIPVPKEILDKHRRIIQITNKVVEEKPKDCMNCCWYLGRGSGKIFCNGQCNSGTKEMESNLRGIM